MKFLKYYLTLVLMTCFGLVQAHIGSPGVNYQGKAGKYDILVNIMPPDVIPGIADVSVYINNYNGEKVYVQTGYFSVGKKGSAAPEIAQPVKGAMGWFDYSAWLMRSGTAGITIIIEGPKGRGTINIPVMAVATATYGMNMALSITLGILGILLFVLMVTIVGASVSDGLVKPGAIPAKVKRRRLVSMAITAFLLLAILYGGRKWCKDERSVYLAFLYKPLAGHSTISTYNGQNVLDLQPDTSRLKFGHEPMSLIVPDHGKLMHLALIKEKTLDVFAHLHPIRKDSLNFLVNLPPLPQGRYLLFGDVVSWDGFAETIVDTVNISGQPAAPNPALYDKKIETSPDDSWLISDGINHNTNAKPVSVCGNAGVSFKLADGSTAVFEHKLNTPFTAKKFCALTFHIFNADGTAAPLQPYMGMTGHAIIMKYDGAVYVHLHPIGNFAMASQEQITQRMNSQNTKTLMQPDTRTFRDSIDRLIAKINSMTEDERNAYLMASMGMGKNMDMPMDNSKCGSLVEFPYAFPGPGKYRIWMQVKIKGKIQTADFDVAVN